MTEINGMGTQNKQCAQIQIILYKEPMSALSNESVSVLPNEPLPNTTMNKREIHVTRSNIQRVTTITIHRVNDN